MILIKLLDGTEIFAKKFEIDKEWIVVWSCKYITHDNGKRKVTYIEGDDNLSIHHDAIKVYFIAHRGKE